MKTQQKIYKKKFLGLEFGNVVEEIHFLQESFNIRQKMAACRSM